MERVTKKDDAGHYYMTGDGIFLVQSIRDRFMGEDVDKIGVIEDILGSDYELSRLRELVEADRDRRVVVLPKDGMVYYIEEAGGKKWVANKPIQQITVKCGWGLASLEFSLLDTGKYFSREAAEAELERGQKNGM